MKVLNNKVTSLTKDADSMITYADLLVILLNKPVQKNVTVKEIRRDMRLIDDFESASDLIEISDDNYTYLLDVVRNSEWGIRHKDIVRFADDFEACSLPPVKSDS
jgi:hypothetical protein